MKSHEEKEIYLKRGSCLKRGQHFIFVIIRKIKKKKNTRILDTLFIDYFIDIIN